MSVTLVSNDWLLAHVDAPEYQVLDPRSTIRYLSGHARNAISVPVASARNSAGRIFDASALAAWLGERGVDAARTPVIYDNSDGRNAALLAWMLLYLGVPEVRVLNQFWEAWAPAGGELFYRPVVAAPRPFHAQPRPELRCTLAEVRQRTETGAALLDLRALEEFTGEKDVNQRPGHIPSARHIAWTEFGDGQQMLAPALRLEALLGRAGVAANAPLVTYCQSGMRAALGFLALHNAGRPVALYDGSYAEWAASGLPVEVSQP